MNTHRIISSREPLRPQPPLPFEAAQTYETTVLEWSGEALPDTIEVVKNCAYGPHEQHRYDVFGATGLRHAPILVFWHGGGWTNGYKEYVSFMADAVTRLGMVLVAPTYRLAPENRLPAAFDDALAALGHVIGHASSFGGDPGRLYLAGHSAGAQIAALVALRRRDVAQAGIDPDSIRACLPISGVMDLHHPEPIPGSMEERVYSMVLRDAADRYGSSAGAIIFSGMTNDAIEGAKYLASKGGTIYAQHPDSCVVSSMIDGVMETGIVKFLGAPRELAEQVLAEAAKAKR